MKLCKDCKHLHVRTWRLVNGYDEKHEYLCNNVPHPVWGGKTFSQDVMHERSLSGSCGPDAIRFEPKGADTPTRDLSDVVEVVDAAWRRVDPATEGLGLVQKDGGLVVVVYERSTDPEPRVVESIIDVTPAEGAHLLGMALVAELRTA